MPSIDGEHGGRAAYVDVAIIAADRYVQHKQSNDLVLRHVERYRALIDTGATRTVVSPRVVRLSDLRPVVRMEFVGVGGPSSSFSYLFHLAFVGAPYPQYAGEDAAADVGINTHHVFKPVINGSVMAEGQSFDVIVGMDVITSGDLQVSEEG